MTDRIRRTTASVFAVVVFGTLTLLAVEPPSDLEIPPELPKLDEFPRVGELGGVGESTERSDVDAALEQQFRDANQGRIVQPSDGIMADVLQVMETNSVLRGSSLDGELNKVPSVDESQKALVAETLLAASRLLESIDKDGRRADLVSKMRAEAGILLTE